MSNLSTPTADQLAAARLAHWHHNADPILTINMLRDWLNTSGLVFFTPRATQLPAPAPSFVEAILGTSNAAPTLAETDQSRSLLSRLILDGGAIPLSLLGSPTGTGSEIPDFIVSPLAFPYIFTLRGDKAWKQPPTTSGASKVSPLALNTYNFLAERAKDHATGMSCYDLTTQLGKEVTETAVLRSLTELWQHLRVIPVPQPDGAATLWELTTARFTKQIKAGANAGQPTALSALISLYLGQAIVASEEDIETFLSPVAARSRIRDVVHALISARQLETIAVEGRTVLHVTGELPAFLAVPVPSRDDIDSLVTVEGESTESGEMSGRITKFIPKPRKVGTGFVSKPSRDSGTATPRERRPFTRESNRLERPSFNKPWEEEKAVRVTRGKSSSHVSEDGDDTTAARKPSRTADHKSSFDRAGKRPTFGSKPAFGSKPTFGDKSRFASNRPSFGKDKPSYGQDRPASRRSEGTSDSRPPRREFSPRPDSDTPTGDGYRPRKTFSKSSTFGRDREGFTGKPSFSRNSSEGRPSRREFAPRPAGDSVDSRPARRTVGDRSAKPGFGGSRKPGSFSARPQRSLDGGDRTNGFAPRKPFVRRDEGAGPSFGGKPSFSRDRNDRGDRGESSGSRPGGPPFRKFDAPRTPRPAFSGRSGRREDFGDSPSKPSGGYAGKSGGGSSAKKPYGKPSGGYAGKSTGASFAGKKPYGKSAAGTSKPASTFDKFKGNKKPFGNRPPARKFKREEGE